MKELLIFIGLLFIAIGLFGISSQQHKKTNRQIKALETKISTLQSDFDWHVVSHDIVEPRPLAINGE